MSTPEVPPPVQSNVPAADTTPGFDEIRVYSHSPLFYWWPVWLFGFVFALITLIDNNRMAIVNGDSLVVKEKVGDKVITDVYGVPDVTDQMSKLTDKATDKEKQAAIEKNSHLKARLGQLPADAEVDSIKPHVSARTWMGPVYLIILMLVIVITNVPLRGLWSLVALIGLVVLVLVISLFKAWDTIL